MARLVDMSRRACPQRFNPTLTTMKPLSIIWQRLVNSQGMTCGRCRTTGEALQQAVATLKEVLRPLDIEPILETRELREGEFRLDPSQSNRVWIAGKPIEDWIAARVASSSCDSVCGDCQCRTLEWEGEIFQAITADMIIKATLIAVAYPPAKRESGGACESKSEGTCGCEEKVPIHA